MLYRNIKTGAELTTRNEVSAPGWVLVPAREQAAPAEAPAKTEPKGRRTKKG